MEATYEFDPSLIKRAHEGRGLIAALDQSGGSTPKALASYGVPESVYTENGVRDAKKMFDLVHAMRTRVMTSPSFTSERILGAILFEQTMDREVEGQPTPSYLKSKGILPFLKIDKGLLPASNGVRLMKDIPDLDELLERAAKKGIFGTKMRSVIDSRRPYRALTALPPSTCFITSFLSTSSGFRKVPESCSRSRSRSTRPSTKTSSTTPGSCGSSPCLAVILGKKLAAF